ncbi:MAG: hypothetical protein COA79_08400 [Planctomycetota bacterium]|nr:MAG: hypothetical protein COA79_08400 [Planctomycetota bacterium]
MKNILFVLGCLLLLSCFINLYGEQEVKKTYFDEAKKKVKAEITYENGKRNGPAKTFHPNGRPLRVVTFKDDKKEGLYFEYHDNGQKKIECTYLQGYLSGFYKEYHSNGRLKLLTRYYQQKDTSVEAPVVKQYNANILTFTEVAYHQDGRRIRRKTPMAFYRIVKDKGQGKSVYGMLRVKNGVEIVYDKKGKVEFKRTYFNDRMDGEFLNIKKIETSQLISDQGKVAAIGDKDKLQE